MRSLMDIEMPAGLAPDLSLPKRNAPGIVDIRKGRTKADEPYFESGTDEWTEHVDVLQRALLGADGPETDVDGESPEDQFFGEAVPPSMTVLMNTERLLLEGAFGMDDDDDVDVVGDNGTGTDNSGSVSSLERTGSGPFGDDLGSFEQLAPREAQLVPLEIKETFLGQARPRTTSISGSKERVAVADSSWEPRKGSKVSAVPSKTKKTQNGNASRKESVQGNNRSSKRG